MAGQAGFEPATRGFGDHRSTIRATALRNYLPIWFPCAAYAYGTNGNISSLQAYPESSAYREFCDNCGACNPNKPM
jgi:hypothetical protein